jgi:hypothetical protein
VFWFLCRPDLNIDPRRAIGISSYQPPHGPHFS